MALDTRIPAPTPETEGPNYRRRAGLFSAAVLSVVLVSPAVIEAIGSFRSNDAQDRGDVPSGQLGERSQLPDSTGNPNIDEINAAYNEADLTSPDPAVVEASQQALADAYGPQP